MNKFEADEADQRNDLAKSAALPLSLYRHSRPAYSITHPRLALVLLEVLVWCWWAAIMA